MAALIHKHEQTSSARVRSNIELMRLDKHQNVISARNPSTKADRVRGPWTLILVSIQRPKQSTSPSARTKSGEVGLLDWECLGVRAVDAARVRNPCRRTAHGRS
jgi:hypothetical protein